MATITGDAILAKVRLILIDDAGVRWSTSELIDWLSDAQRAIIALRPDANTVNETFVCVAGSKQTLPAEAIRLIKVVRNTFGVAVTFVDGSWLDEQDPYWHTDVQTTSIRHYIYDDRDPKTFYVYPPAVPGSPIDIVYSRSLPDVADSSLPIDIDDTYANAIFEYILFRCYSKDSDDTVSAAQAQTHHNNFRAALDIITQSDAATSPNA